MQFKPEEKGADFSIYLQSDLMKEAGLESGDNQGQLEWVLKNRIKFRKMIESHPELKGLYMEDYEKAIKLAKEFMEETEADPDDSLRNELTN